MNTEFSEDNQKIVRQQLPCESCGSSDAVALYADGHTHCFSCGEHVIDKEEGQIPMATNISNIKSYLTKGEFTPITDRRISIDTARKFGIETTLASDGKIAGHIYKYFDKNGEHVANKKRICADKKFSWEGNAPRATLFGQQLFNNGGKMITLCEGEIDAASIYQMNGGFPVVSIANGAQSAAKECKKHYEFLDNFEKIVICFDNDDVGRKAAKEVAEIFSPGKCAILTTDLKDANTYLMENKSNQFMREFWDNQRVYTPEGIVCLSDLWETLSVKDDIVSVKFPWEGLQDMTYGMRLGELCTYAAGTGQGKSTTMRELAYHIISSTKYNVGMLFLEESIKRTGLALMGIHASKPFHLHTCEYSDQEFKEAFDAVSLDRRVFMFDHFGSWDIDKLVQRVKYMARGLECKFIFLDHVSIIVSAGDQGDERRALDEVMTKLRMLVQELNIHLAVVTHLKRIQGNGHEEGSAVSLSHLRGSAGIAQLSDMVISFERDSQNNNEDIRNTTTVRVLKNRFSGDTGPATFLQYDRKTGRQFEIDSMPEADHNDEVDNTQTNDTFSPVPSIDGV